MKLQTYTTQKLITERNRKELREWLAEQQGRRLIADNLDTTSDMFDPAGIESDLGLFTRKAAV